MAKRNTTHSTTVRGQVSVLVHIPYEVMVPLHGGSTDSQEIEDAVERDMRSRFGHLCQAVKRAEPQAVVDDWDYDGVE